MGGKARSKTKGQNKAKKKVKKNDKKCPAAPNFEVSQDSSDDEGGAVMLEEEEERSSSTSENEDVEETNAHNEGEPGTAEVEQDHCNEEPLKEEEETAKETQPKRSLSGRPVESTPRIDEKSTTVVEDCVTIDALPEKSEQLPSPCAVPKALNADLREQATVDTTGQHIISETNETDRRGQETNKGETRAGDIEIRSDARNNGETGPPPVEYSSETSSLDVKSELIDKNADETLTLDETRGPTGKVGTLKKLLEKRKRRPSQDSGERKTTDQGAVDKAPTQVASSTVPKSIDQGGSEGEQVSTTRAGWKSSAKPFARADSTTAPKPTDQCGPKTEPLSTPQAESATVSKSTIPAESFSAPQPTAGCLPKTEPLSTPQAESATVSKSTIPAESFSAPQPSAGSLPKTEPLSTPQAESATVSKSTIPAESFSAPQPTAGSLPKTEPKSTPQASVTVPKLPIKEASIPHPGAKSKGDQRGAPLSPSPKKRERPAEVEALMQGGFSQFSPVTTSRAVGVSEVIESEPSGADSMEAVTPSCSSPRRPVVERPSPRGDEAREPTDVESEEDERSIDVEEGGEGDLLQRCDQDGRMEADWATEKLKEQERAYDRELARQTEAYRKALQDHEAEKAKLNLTLLQKQREQDAERAEIVKLKSALALAQKQFEDKIDECRLLIDESTRVQGLKISLENRQSRLDTQEEELRSLQDQQRREKDEWEIETRKKTAHLEELKVIAEHATEEFKKESQIQRAQLRAERDELEQRSAELHRRETTVMQREQALDETNKATLECFSELLKKLDVDLTGKTVSAEDIAIELDRWKEAHDDKLSELETNLAKTRKKLQESSNYSTDVREENVKLHAEITRLALDKDKEIEKLRLRALEQKSQHDALQHRETELIKMLDNLTAAESRLESLVMNTRAELEECKRTLELTKHDSKLRLAALSKAERELDHAQREIRALQEDVAVRDIANASLTQTVEKLKARPFLSRLINQD